MRTKRQQAIIRRRIFLSVMAVVLTIAVIGLFLTTVAIYKAIKSDNNHNTSSLNQSASQTLENKSQNDNSAKPIGKTVTATVINTGDIILHDRIFKDALLADGTFDFSDFFKVADKRFSSADYAVANLEVTLGGPIAGKEYSGYSGFPAFNSPDSLLDPIKSAGFDLLLTANNHSYDTGFAGLKRTVQKVKEYGFDFIGTKEIDSDPVYIVKDVNGIRIGITCFTYETKSASDGRKTLNGNVLSKDAQNYINSFDYDEINEFYKTAETIVGQMRKDGADAIVFYMHWGEEYQRTPNTWQKTIAQKLCNMGVDVIVGGHPHVLQPVSLLHAEGSSKTTVCAYSLGNAISNQRRELLKTLCPTGHSEDGAIFYYTFTKYPDGTTSLTAVDLIPTWLDKYSVSGKYRYTMYPIDDESVISPYRLDSATQAKLLESYKRSTEIVANGLTECQQELDCEIRFKD